MVISLTLNRHVFDEAFYLNVVCAPTCTVTNVTLIIEENMINVSGNQIFNAIAPSTAGSRSNRERSRVRHK
jgi:hypothetical protein